MLMPAQLIAMFSLPPYSRSIVSPSEMTDDSLAISATAASTRPFDRAAIASAAARALSSVLAVTQTVAP
jgi:hypothetical protein